MKGKDYGYFTAIDVFGGFDMIFKHSEECSAIFEQEGMLTRHLDIFVRDETLHIHFNEPMVRPKDVRYKAYVFAPKLESAAMSGASRAIDWDTIATQNFLLAASGQADVNISFDVKRLKIQASGSSLVEVSGNGGSVDIVASGSAEVRHRGFENAQQSVSGSGSINRID